MRWVVLVAVTVSIAGPGPRVWAGDIVGTVRWTGPVPPAVPVATTKDRAVCGAEVEDETLLVTGGRVANVLLLVKGAPAAPPTTATLDQERCRYRPHAQVVPVGSTLDVTNSDELLHSVHGWAGRVTRFDVVTPSKGVRVPTKLGRPGIVQIRCDVHAWMSAVVLVADGPAAVTGRDGAFEIRGVPGGTYTVTGWHERLGERSVEVTVPERGPVKLELVFAP
jgi:plastocyanin